MVDNIFTLIGVITTSWIIASLLVHLIEFFGDQAMERERKQFQLEQKIENTHRMVFNIQSTCFEIKEILNNLPQNPCDLELSHVDVADFQNLYREVNEIEESEIEENLENKGERNVTQDKV